ncbi:MAG: type VI secretion system baseplate subunit TssG [Deltaproteobacteria bacterium]|nr:type VI secretion system baseplate subunit TssG [Deltaproteobacteria bacterium]
MSSDLINKILADGHEFSFFQLIRLLEILHEESPGLGTVGPAEEEAIRLRPDQGHGFPKADVLSVTREKPAGHDRERFQVMVGFLGLYGVTSPLPTIITKAIDDPDDPDAVRLRAFLDLFNHRLLSLFYRSWAKYRYDVRFRSDGQDEFSRRLLPLTGLAPTAATPDLPHLELLTALGLLTQLPRSAAGLAGFLSVYLDDVPIRISQCVSRYVFLKPDQKNALGCRNSTAGLDCLAGERVEDRSGKFRIHLGPLTWPAFLNLVPSNPRYKLLLALINLFLMDPLDFEVELILKGGQIPQPVLGKDRPRYLGWTTWLGAGRGDDRSIILTR